MNKLMLKPEYQEKLRQAVIDSTCKVDSSNKFVIGFVAGLEAAGLSEYEIFGTGLAGYMIKLHTESLNYAYREHINNGGTLYATVKAAQIDADKNVTSDIEWEIHSVTYEDGKPKFEMMLRRGEE